MFPYEKKFVSLAQNLRKNMTKEERRLWYDFLKKLPLTVKRQHNIGNYIVDFYIASKKTVIEIDGAQHGEQKQEELDKERQLFLSKLGITVLRYSNTEINKNFKGVAKDLLQKLKIDETDLKNF